MANHSSRLFESRAGFCASKAKPLLQIVLWFSAAATGAATETVPLTALDLTKMAQGYGTPQVNRSIRERPLSIGGKVYETGVGTHANSSLTVELAGGTERFKAFVGVDDAAGGEASVVFKIFADGKKVWDSGLMLPGRKAREVDLPLHGVKRLRLEVEDGGDGIHFDHANWAEARFIVSGAKPKAVESSLSAEPAVILTPKPGPAPRINGPRVYGCRPGNPFIYRIPVQGERPMKFTARDLPSSLKLDPAIGIITGLAPAPGEYEVRLKAANRHGETTRSFRIVAGSTLALTPPMGWNHWYAHYHNISDEMMREAADTLIRSGMADVGYDYVNIDDCWMNAEKHSDPLRVGPARDPAGNILPNRHFPDMKALTDYIHSKGLKAGIYTSPGLRTCAGFAGALGHEAQDARTFADWGFDFLKYDWCSYSAVAAKQDEPELTKLKYPYQVMGDLLKQQKRDIVFNLCQYGMGNVWEWGKEVGGHCWRTAGDLGFELRRIFEVALRNAEHRAWSRPGAWNDPDYIQIGFTGERDAKGAPKPFPLSPNERYAFMSLWCLMAAPLFYSGDMSCLDEFTLNVLCNPEVIDVDQDPLGQSAAVAVVNEEMFLMVKELADGSKAVGLFNRGETPTVVSVPWAVAGITGEQVVRDLWRQKELGRFRGAFAAEVPQRGVLLVRMRPAK